MHGTPCDTHDVSHCVWMLPLCVQIGYMPHPILAPAAFAAATTADPTYTSLLPLNDPTRQPTTLAQRRICKMLRLYMRIDSFHQKALADARAHSEASQTTFTLKLATALLAARDAAARAALLLPGEAVVNAAAAAASAAGQQRY